jgi:hypothetical protein
MMVLDTKRCSGRISCYAISAIGSTRSLKYRKLSPYQKPAISVAITKFKATMFHHTKVIFDDVGDILPSSGCDPQSRRRRAALARCRGERYQ